MSHQRLEWQLIARARPGIVDTSALPMDFVSNPGTMNAIINFARRPLHEARVLKWRKTASCAAGAAETACWCEPEKPGKCWERTERTEPVPNVLKGGEDSIGFDEAIQRVYFNIGSCAEQCWLNHISDLRAVDPAQRNYGQTPFDIGQCRRDCASFRAIEDRLGDVKAFFLAARPTDLWRARGYGDPRDLELALDAEHFEGAVELGRNVFAQSCARCHSSQPGPYVNVDFRATDPADPTLRLDWLGNDEPVLATEVGTYPARALHSNHMPSRVWEQYASLDLHERPADPSLPEVMKGSGRGYYRNISLLSAWAHAPFMHNNAIGPEICGKPKDPALDFYSSPYVDAEGKPLADPPACWRFDVSVEGRYRLYKASMEELLHPDRRTPKMHYLDQDVIVDIAPRIKIGDLETGLSVRVPAGFPAVALNSLRFKDMLQDAILAARDPAKLEQKYSAILTPERMAGLKQGLAAIRQELLAKPGYMLLDITQVQSEFIQSYYSNVLEHIDNKGHRFGEELSEREKQALIAFVATL
jgi:mono/diheme cytochrome c family protein